MSVRWLVFGVWGLAALSAAAWGLKLSARPEPVPAQASVAGVAPLGGGDWSRVLGASTTPAQSAAPQAPPDSARFQLVGVAAPKGPADGQGVALLVVDGKPARAYRQGAAIDERLLVRRIEQRRVTIGLRDAEGTFDLELPPQPPPATGVPAGLAAPGGPMAGLPGMPRPGAAIGLPVPGQALGAAPPAMPGALPQGGVAVPPMAGQGVPQPVQALTPEQAEQVARRTRRTVPLVAPNPVETLPGEQPPPTGGGRDRR